ncbi:MAG: TonB C-terminal domain-containing protein [Psychrobacter sp.]|nr:TonB C-terminal domain-containing protein [Psychrobacter sp.]
MITIIKKASRLLPVIVPILLLSACTTQTIGLVDDKGFVNIRDHSLPHSPKQLNDDGLKETIAKQITSYIVLPKTVTATTVQAKIKVSESGEVTSIHIDSDNEALVHAVKSAVYKASPFPQLQGTGHQDLILNLIILPHKDDDLSIESAQAQNKAIQQALERRIFRYLNFYSKSNSEILATISIDDSGRVIATEVDADNEMIVYEVKKAIYNASPFTELTGTRHREIKLKINIVGSP